MHFDLTTIFELAGWVLAGGLGLYGIFNRQRKQTKQEDDQVAANLITNLKSTADLQKEEITTLRAKEVEQGKEIAHLQGQVKVLSEIFQNRNPEMTEFMKLLTHASQQGMEYMNTTSQMLLEMKKWMERVDEHIQSEAGVAK